MQHDMERFEQPLVSDTPLRAGVWTDIGEAEVSNTLFGTATVRIHRRRDALRSARLWTLAMLLLVVGGVWLVRDMARQPEVVYVAPSAPPLEIVAPVPEMSPPKPRTYPLRPLAGSSAPAVASPVQPFAASAVPDAMPGLSSPIAPVQDEPAERGITSVRH
jgi:hypothetical protein